MNLVGAEGSPSPVPGAKAFGKYYLLDRIGAGGMAEVFLAVAIGPEGFQRMLVIKRMLPHLSQDRAFVRMFVDEAKLCGLLSHPNLVQIFEFGSIEGSFFIAMEHVQGETLSAVRAKLAETGRLAPVAATLEMMRQVCLGLHYAHSLQSATGQPLGIIHRDISPSNLMLSFHGGVKILDFGIARVAEGLRETHTQAGTMKGKVSYMSPEQIRMEQVDSRSDVFAVGIVLHEFLCGKRLFKATNEYNGARMVLESVVPRPSTVNPDVTPEVDKIVMRALERDREARYLTAGEMAEDLEKVLFEMRASPHEPRKLLISLFPQGPSRTGEVRLPVMTPSPVLIESGSSMGSGGGLQGTSSGSSAVPSPIAVSASLSASNPTKPLTPGGIEEIEMADLAPSTRSGARRRAGRRRWSLLGGLVGVVVAVIVLAHPPWAVKPSEETTVTPATAHPSAQPGPEATGHPAAAQQAQQAQQQAVKATVDISLDSTPQEAQVIREDTGAVVGHTPVTITLPQGREVIAFRFEKAGHTAASYKVIPDLDKSVRAELLPSPVEEPKHAPPPVRHGQPVRGKGPATGKDARPAVSETPAPAVEQGRGCLMSVGSFPWAELWIDGKDTGQRTPVVHYPVSCGAHRLTLKRRDLNLNRSEQVTVAPDHELKQHYELSDEYGD
jgi:serine/threonine-protein kinase